MKVGSIPSKDGLKKGAMITKTDISKLKKLVKNRVLEIPENFFEEPILSVGASTFSNVDFIEEIIFPDSLISLGESFMSKSSIKKIRLGKDFETFHDDAFAGVVEAFSVEISEANIAYESFDGTLYERDSKNLALCGNGNIAPGTEMILSGSFNESPLFSIFIPKSVKRIGDSAFNGAIIQKVEFEKGSTIETIEERAFCGCLLLDKIHIPASVHTIGYEAFAHSGLKTVDFECRDKNIDLLIREHAFTDCCISSIKIEGGIDCFVQVGNCAFLWNKIEELHFDVSLELGDDVFQRNDIVKIRMLHTDISSTGTETMGYKHKEFMSGTFDFEYGPTYIFEDGRWMLDKYW